MLFVGILVGACKRDEAQKNNAAASAAASQIAATTASGAAAAPASAAPAASANAPVGSCKRLKPGTNEHMCNLAKDYCCENAATGQEKCVPHKDAKGLSCSDDGAWRLAIGCSTSSMCGPSQKCCVQEPVPGFLQTVCAATCQHEEACLPNMPGAECKDPQKFDCVASPTSRTGGRCVANGGAGVKVAQCPAGLVRIVATGKPGGECVESCGSMCSGGEDPVEATMLKDDGSPGAKINVRPQAPKPKLAQCGAGFARIVVPGQPGGACRLTCGSVCGGGENPVEATLLKDDGSPGGKVNVHP